MSKKEDLETIDTEVRKFILNSFKNRDTERLIEINPVINYLAKNNAVEDKAKSTVEEDIEARLAKAKKRRDSKCSS